MLELREIQLSDKDWIKELLSYSDYRGCEYSFGNNFAWRNVYNIKIGRFKDFYIVKSNGEFIFPAGRGSITELIDHLKEYCAFHGEALTFCSSDKSIVEQLKELYANEIEITSNRDYFDYVYRFEDLSTLSGKKYHSKRNFINRFTQSQNWAYEPITRENIHECKEMNKLWCEANQCSLSLAKTEESCAVECGLNNFFDLDFEGGLLRVDGKVQAFTFGERLNSDTFVVHVEKAMTDIPGAYPMINYQFVNHLCKEFAYINREEDMGEPNLRKAKESYRPVFIQEKFQIRFV